MWPQQFSNRIEYDTRTVKVTTKVMNDYQQETVYTYDKYGRLESTVIHKSDIASV
jgi:hypothetical protein